MSWGLSFSRKTAKLYLNLSGVVLPLPFFAGHYFWAGLVQLLPVRLRFYRVEVALVKLESKPVRTLRFAVWACMRL
jgi:hypothetical protein